MKVLVVYYGMKSTFIQRDIDILAKHFEVDEISIQRIRDLFLLIKKIRNADVVYIWFAGKHAGVSVLLSKIFRKKSVVIVGGYDVANVPEIGYGLWHWGDFLDKFLCKYAISHADYVLAVSNFHKKEMLKIAKPKKYSVVYNGVPDDFCGREEIQKVEGRVLTVCYLKKENIMIKGLKTYMRLAKLFPNLEFIIMGKPLDNSVDILRKDAPSNVKIVEDDQGLRNAYRSSQIYMQLSAYESFGIAVVEAMQCGCIPVVTNRGALPEVVGDAGVIVEYGNVESIINGLKKALEWAKDKNKINRAIERAKKFSLTKREKKLVKILREIHAE